ncbi:hypothetical protein GGR54DRAFT_275854 [Hypoxylon sp. NC1633]|nr:hypothetical protein GGR54DRAFT_275854 [Hypoxylon sp. NC1633]
MDLFKKLRDFQNMKRRKASTKRPCISPPLETLVDRLGQGRAYHGRRHKTSASRLDFTPRTRGTEATVAWLKTGMSDELIKILDERDHAERQVHLGPRTKGTEEVQLVLRDPCKKSAERFHHARKQAEFTERYGVTGRVVYNFSRSIGWNKDNAPMLPPLQLTDFGAMMRENKRLFPDTLTPPIDWIDLGMSGTPGDNKKPLSPISEPGGWRDTPPSSEGHTIHHDNSTPVAADVNVEGEEREALEEGKALTVTMTKISVQMVRQVHVHRIKPKSSSSSHQPFEVWVS